MADFSISSKSFNECVKKYSNGEYCYDSESKITGFRKVVDNSEMPEEEYDDFTEGFFKYIIGEYDLGNVEIEYWDVSASDEDEIIFVYSIIMGKDTVSKEYYYSEFQKLVEKLMPGYHIGTSDVDESIIFFSTIYGVDDYECLEILKQRLRNELAAREVIEIEYNAFNHTYTVIYEKITNEFVRENIIGKYTAKVVGTQFENRPENHSGLRIGESVKLVREPDNSYDTNAISVRTLSDLELGHLPAEIAGDISAYIDNDFVVVEKAVVSHTKAFTKSGTLMKRPELEIEFYLQFSAIDFKENGNDANNAFDELNANLNEFQENPDEKAEEIREKYRPDHFLEEMKSNPGYTIWAAFEFALAALSDTVYDQNIISNAEKALESDEYINTLNIDLFGLMIYSRALGDEGSEMTREFLKSLVAAAAEKSDKSDLIDLMNKLREKVVINKISFLEISKIVSSVLKLDDKTNSNTNGHSSINIFSESSSPKSAEKIKATEEFEIEEMVNDLSGAAEKLQKAEKAGEEADRRHKEEHRKLTELKGTGAKINELTMFVTLLIEKSVGKIRRNQKEFCELYSEDFPDLSKDKLIELRKTIVPKMNDEKFVKRCSNAIKQFPFEQRYGMLTLSAFNVALYDDPEKAKAHALELSKDFLDPQETERAASLLNEQIDNIKKTMADGLSAFDNNWLKFSTAKKYLKFYTEDKYEDYNSKNIFDFKSSDGGYCYVVLRVNYLYSPLNSLMPWFWGVSVTDVYDAANENPINDMTSSDKGRRLVDQAMENAYKKYGNGKEAPEKKDGSVPSATEREAVGKLKKMVAIAEDNLRLASDFYTNASQELITAAEDIVSTLRSTSADALAKFRDQSEETLLAYVRSNGISAVNSLYTSFSETSEEIKKTFAEYGIVAFSSASSQSAKTSSTSANSSSNSSGGCYVATCVYGSYDCPQVWTLRRFRDYILAKTWYGRLFIALYYAISPHIVKAFGKTKWFNNLWKPVLDKMVDHFHRKGIADSYYYDIN